MVQYWHFLSNTARGNLGVSYYNGGEPVKTITVQDLPITASVVIGGLVLWLTAGLSAGILSATRPAASSTAPPPSACSPACHCPPSCSANC